MTARSRTDAQTETACLPDRGDDVASVGRQHDPLRVHLPAKRLRRTADAVIAGHARQDKITGQTAPQPLPGTVISHAATVDVVSATGQTLSHDRKLRTRMIEWRFTADDVARIRFAFSPLWELVLSLIVLREPSRHALHLSWIRAVRPQLGALDLSEVFALVPVHGPVADFLTPPPTSPLPDFAAELDTVRRTPATAVLADIVDVPGVPNTVQRRIHQDPSGALSRIADILQAYWDVALAAHWPRLLAVLQADVLWRSRQLALGGAHGLFEDLHDTIVWHGDRLTAADHWNYTGALHGEGLLLVPSAMAWPDVRKMVEPYQPVIAYPARGVATLWETGEQPSAHTLAALIGTTRAQLLLAVEQPSSTTSLAARLRLSPAAVSQHLSVLASNGLVTRARVGHSVLYHRTARGDTLAAHDYP